MLIQDTLARQRRVLGEDDLRTLGSMHNLAEVLVRTGDLQTARELHEEVLVRRQRLLGSDHRITRLSVLSLVEILDKMGEYSLARAMADDALTQVDNHPYTLLLLTRLAVVSAHLGQFTRARELANQALAEQRQILPPEHPEIRGMEAFLRELHSCGRLVSSDKRHHDTANGSAGGEQAAQIEPYPRAWW